MIRYRAALETLDALEFEYYAAAARDRLGQLVGGDEGAALRADTRARLEQQKVRDPEAMLAMILPAGATA